MPDRIVFGAAALPEPERHWLAAVERLPIESVWQGGHVLPPTGTGEAITRLALMTAWTERVRVGTAILLLPLYQPVIVAKQLADLDARSGGRVSVGLGVGGEFKHEFDSVGVPITERGARTDEAMVLLRELWRGEPVTHHGKYFDVEDVTLRPVTPPPPPGSTSGPAGGQPGGPPLLVSGRKAPAMRRAARLGDGWMPYLMSPSAYARSVETISAEAAATGRDLGGFEWMMYVYCSVRADGDRARADVASFLGGAYGDKPASMLDKIAPSGTPEQVAARLQEYVDAGVRHFVISPAAHEDTLEVVQLAAEEVLPRLTLPAGGAAGPVITTAGAAS
ncbi:LLM class flavin-dependent oxidoreductase [Pseudofrankia inefficax]|uniref:Luciferase-like, subgroup n=1 Tax=Pseudofrankia inefficax (strain DSM 45817 / CECT 9037 / DDB 130130 / EuI1c) TaxID=298654 RepID=E3JAU7_PSEI1|nr:LLM class flavin-dependent oxidoreductase [Pseudofrankia inefficax]ADP83435.1 Luciferase-like, subgroup [Pseudofrankia inefficax]